MVRCIKSLFNIFTHIAKLQNKAKWSFLWSEYEVLDAYFLLLTNCYYQRSNVKYLTQMKTWALFTLIINALNVH